MRLGQTRRAFIFPVIRAALTGLLVVAVVACGGEGDDALMTSTDDNESRDRSLGKADSLLSKSLSKYKPYIEHRSAIQVGKQVYTFLKLNYGKGKLGQLVLDKYGAVVPAGTALSKIRGQYKAYGKIHPALWRVRAKNYYGDHQVLVWLNLKPKVINKPRFTSSIKSTMANLAKVHAKNLSAFKVAKTATVKKLGLYNAELLRDIPGAPFIVTRLRGNRISQLAKSQAVQMLMRYDNKGINDINNSLAVSNADDVIAAGTTGDNVSVAVWEDGPTNANNLNIQNSYTNWAGITGDTTDHAENVTGIVNAYAPDAEIYSADTTDLAALDWAIDTIGVTALNQSFHRAAEIDDGMSADDLYKDYKVLQYPWPFISQAAGNWCGVRTTCYEGGSDVTDEFVNHKGYNSISIGNHNDNATSMSASSCFVNPSSPHGDRELPELSANGVWVNVRGINMNGTSMASPAVVGTAALLQETATILKLWPEGVRALLFAGSKINVPSHSGQLAGGGNAADAPNTWWRDLSLGNDGFDGAGALDAQESARIAKHFYNGIAKARGWDIGRMTDASFDSHGYYTKSYKVKVPSLFNQHKSSPGLLLLRRKVKVALAWDSTAIMIPLPIVQDLYFSFLGLDLDIRVYDSAGNQVAHSLSWDNSYEVVDFDGKPGQTYTIRVHRWPSSSTSGAWTWFGIAWAAR